MLSSVLTAELVPRSSMGSSLLTLLSAVGALTHKKVTNILTDVVTILQKQILRRLSAEISPSGLSCQHKPEEFDFSCSSFI